MQSTSANDELAKVKAQLAKLKADNDALAKAKADSDAMLSKAKADNDGAMDALAKAKGELDAQLSAKEQQHKLALAAHEQSIKAKGINQSIHVFFVRFFVVCVSQKPFSN